MKNDSFLWIRVLGAIIALGLIAGAAAFGYQAGVAQGISQAPAVAKAIEKAAENGQVAPPMMRGFGYGYSPFPFYRFSFFPLGALCGSIFFLFLLFGAIKMLFFRRMAWSGGRMRGPWGWRWEGGVPPMFDEWHKRAHGEAPEGEKKTENS